MIAVDLASVLGYGINQYQIQHINDVVKDLQLESLHRDNKIGILESTVDFNTKTIDKLQRV